MSVDTRKSPTGWKRRLHRRIKLVDDSEATVDMAASARGVKSHLM